MQASKLKQLLKETVIIREDIENELSILAIGDDAWDKVCSLREQIELAWMYHRERVEETLQCAREIMVDIKFQRASGMLLENRS